MSGKRSYYILFQPAKQIDYLYLLALYDLASYNPERKVFDSICYSSVSDLAKSLDVSPSTMTRILNSPNYYPYFTVNKEAKTITLKNNFQGASLPFVQLLPEEVALMRKVKEPMFSKYLIYMKYYCGYSKKKSTDFTAKQFLSAYGYSIKANASFSALGRYNNILESNGLITIKTYFDDKKHTRNEYSWNR